MIEILKFFVEMLFIPGVALKLGFMLAATVVIGFILFDEWGQLWKWITLIVAFAFFHEWIYVALVQQRFLVTRPSALVYATVILYLIGIVIGMLFAWRLTSTRKRDVEAAKKVYEVLKHEKSNGDIAPVKFL